MNRRRGLALGFAVAVSVVSAGCGVPTDDRPRPIDPPVATGSPSPLPAGDPAGIAVERLYLVRDDQLRAVERRLDAPPDVARQLRDLLAGPTGAERDAGLTSALTGTDLVVGVQLDGGIATVDVSRRLDSAGRNDEVLAYGQIVCTLDARADVDAVLFVRGAEPLDVPRADGSLTTVPLTASDYAPLIGG